MWLGSVIYVTELSRDVVELAERRAQARAERDFVSADHLRDEIAAAGWVVHDTPGGGFDLTAKPPFEVWPTVESIPVAVVVVDISRLDQGGTKAGQALTGADERARQWAHARDEAASAESAGDRPERQHKAAGPALASSRAETARAATEASGDTAPIDPTAPGGMIETALTPAGTPSMVASQLLWDGSSATNRIDQVIADHEKSTAARQETARQETAHEGTTRPDTPEEGATKPQPTQPPPRQAAKAPTDQPHPTQPPSDRASNQEASD
ncbi:CysS/YqeB C-terminal domain-containing protein, partial [Acrocarpospora phusangensis]|uniref:CysS/YqeB C-terminal domain-containing protein n=1 Tax=Acrocarpospora phusangensis TaxID=1070424 RepID=UPI004039D75C